MISETVGVFQDIVTRYATGTGHHCPRRFGWDCHGLPVEYEIDKKLGRLLLLLAASTMTGSCWECWIIFCLCRASAGAVPTSSQHKRLGQHGIDGCGMPQGRWNGLCDAPAVQCMPC